MTEAHWSDEALAAAKAKNARQVNELMPEQERGPLLNSMLTTPGYPHIDQATMKDLVKKAAERYLMTDPVERLEQWCDEQEARQMRPGQQRDPGEFWPLVDGYRRLITLHNDAALLTQEFAGKRAILSVATREKMNELPGLQTAIRVLADALAPAPK